MADRMAAEILIGGLLSYAQAEGLCAAIEEQYLALDWGGGVFCPQTPAELLEAAKGSTTEGGWLRLTDDEARQGQFEVLEEFLRKEKIPYERRSAGKYDYDAELASYRPEAGLSVSLTTMAGEPVTANSLLQKIQKDFNTLLKSSKNRRLEPAEILSRLENLLRRFRKILPPELPPLPAFEIQGISDLRRPTQKT